MAVRDEGALLRSRGLTRRATHMAIGTAARFPSWRCLMPIAISGPGRLCFRHTPRPGRSPPMHPSGRTPRNPRRPAASRTAGSVPAPPPPRATTGGKHAVSRERPYCCHACQSSPPYASDDRVPRRRANTCSVRTSFGNQNARLQNSDCIRRTSFGSDPLPRPPQQMPRRQSPTRTTHASTVPSLP